MTNKKKQIIQEIVLAVVLALFLGIAGDFTKDKVLAGDRLEEQVIAENQDAAGQEDKDTDTDADQDMTSVSEKKTDATGETEEVLYDGQYSIMGASTVTVEQMAAWYKQNGADYPEEELGKGGAETIEAFCQIYMEEAEAEGVRVEVAFAQTMKETAWLQYGGDASIEQYNFAGLGTTGGGVPGNSFADVRTGVRAQIQHLKAYATEESLSQECVDSRYEYVMKGSAPFVEWLGQQENPQGVGWATDENYGYSIVAMIQNLKLL